MPAVIGQEIGCFCPASQGNAVFGSDDPVIFPVDDRQRSGVCFHCGQIVERIPLPMFFRGQTRLPKKEVPMSRRRQFAYLLLLISLFAFPHDAGAGFGDLLRNAVKAVGGSGALSDTDIADGLREALTVGAEKAVASASRTDGYYKNADIRIPLPDAVSKTEGLLRAAGFGGQVDAFELSMNRAAETAAPEAKKLFWNAVAGMTFADAKGILNGPEDAATRYLEEKTASDLSRIFRPIVGEAMNRVGVTRTYKDLNSRLALIPFANKLSMDLDGYVTSRSLDGLFVLLAKEEAAIRRDPAARVTDLLKKVFGRR